MIHALVDPTGPDERALAPFDALVQGKRVVMLGESAHGVREFSALKAQLVQHLHRSHGFNLLAFESPLPNCAAAAAQIGRVPAMDAMRTALYPVWHTREVLSLFETLAAGGTNGPLRLCGFDIQSFGAARRAFDEKVLRAMAAHRPQLAARWQQRVAIRPGMSRAEADSLSALLQEVLDAVASTPGLRDDWEAIRELRSQIAQAASWADLGHDNPTRRADGMTRRDRAMAENLAFLLDVAHPHSRCIVWAHNAHISRQAQHGVTPMGAWLAQQRDDIASIGLFMGRGEAAANDRSLYTIDPPQPDTLEARALAGGQRAVWVDVRHAAPDSPWQRPMRCRDWGVYDTEVVPAQAYDAVIVIDTVQAPQYV